MTVALRSPKQPGGPQAQDPMPVPMSLREPLAGGVTTGGKVSPQLSMSVAERVIAVGVS